MTLRERLLSLKPKGKNVTIEGIGEVFIAQMTGAEFIALQEVRSGIDDTAEFAIVTIQQCLKDADGERVFKDGAEEKAILKSLPYSTISALFSEILKVNTLTDKSVEEAKKN